MNAHYFSALKADSKERYRQVSDLVALKDCLYCLPADLWCNNSVQWHEVKDPNIYDYLINTPGKSERATQFLDFLVWLFKFFTFEKAHRRATNYNHKEIDSYIMPNQW